MSYAAHAAFGEWTKRAQANRTASATSMGKVIRLFNKPVPSTFLAVNEIQVYGTTQRIRSLKDWGANWDGAEAVEVSPATIERATALINEMYVTAFQADINWRDPNVTASPDGEVVLEWWNRRRKLTIYVSETQSDYVKVWGPDIDEEMEDGVLSAHKVAELLVWLEA